MSKQGPKDVNETAFKVFQEALGEVEPSKQTLQGKNPAAVALGRLGGLKGGKARAEKLSKDKLKEIASRAAAARWARKSNA
jgi:hypothetical protein